MIVNAGKLPIRIGRQRFGGVGQVLRASCSSVLRLMAALGISRNELLRSSLVPVLSMYRLLQAEASLVLENELLADGGHSQGLCLHQGGH